MSTESKLAILRPQEAGITRASLQHTKAQLELLEEFVDQVLRPNQDFGIIPGTTKPTLLKPGSSNIISAFNCHSEPHIDHEILEPEATDARPDSIYGFASYTVHVDVISNLTGNLVARGFGQCNSEERKYRYRTDQRRCPECGATAIIKGKEDFGGGWLCWRKKDGCGAKFADGDASIESQSAGQVENPDRLDQANTYLKMAIKRAEVDAALRLPGVARFFTQDIEDIMGQPPSDDDDDSDSPPKRSIAPRARGSAPQKPGSTPAKPETPTITEADLRARVEQDGMPWDTFEIEVLRTTWATFLKTKGASPAVALARWKTWQKSRAADAAEAPTAQPEAPEQPS